MKLKIAINGFGRIGRPVFKRILDAHPELDVIAINDLADEKTMAHLLKYDSVYGIYQKNIRAGNGFIQVGDKVVKTFSEQDPKNLPWAELEIDMVLECTGRFTNYDGAKKHLEAGAKKVIISAPSDDPERIPSFCMNVNIDPDLIKRSKIVDMGSCTTNCAVIVAEVLHKNLRIKKALFSTIHSYTNDQRILDLAHKDLRRARAAGLNIIPTTTGAAKTIQRVLPDLKGRVQALAFRVPTPTVSVVDFVCEVEKETSVEEVNYLFKEATQKEEYKGILWVEDAPLVSSDYIGNSFSAIVDSNLTMVVGNLVRVVAWYDNEWGYACRLAEFAEFIGKNLLMGE